MTTWLTRYTSGDTDRVWLEMLDCGSSIREGALLEDAMAVARETMRRVRANAEVVHGRLRDIGYAFERPASALVAPSPHAIDEILEVETTLGPLPLSLRAFYEIVGAIDFRQSFKQLVNWRAREGRAGFRGHIECEPEGEKGWKIPPRMQIAQTLADGLLSF